MGSRGGLGVLKKRKLCCPLRDPNLGWLVPFLLSLSLYRLHYQKINKAVNLPVNVNGKECV